MFNIVLLNVGKISLAASLQQITNKLTFNDLTILKECFLLQLYDF